MIVEETQEILLRPAIAMTTAVVTQKQIETLLEGSASGEAIDQTGEDA